MIRRLPVLWCRNGPVYFTPVVSPAGGWHGVLCQRTRPTWPHVPMLKTRIKPILKDSAQTAKTD